jgi:hypothetical protein
MIVKDFYIGNTHIKIHDDCCVKTQKEVDEILARLARIVINDRNSKVQAASSETMP